MLALIRCTGSRPRKSRGNSFRLISGTRICKSRHVSPAATRTEQASALALSYPRLEERVDSNRLARQADAASFAPEPVNAEQANRYWRGIDLAVSGLRASVSRRQAWFSRLSTRSFHRVG